MSATGIGEVRVDVSAIEKSLSQLWRGEQDGEDAVTRAALWNVVAHTSSSEAHATASEILGRASAAVPQRTIVVRANPAEEEEIASWISANCHRLGGGKQVCSEEISIVAGGSHIRRIPPVVNALLIPDMPVAVWWVGDLPNEHSAYVDALLEPADRLIVDSVHFDSPADLALICRVGHKTSTAPADLNWVRLEEWRAATASIFDPPAMRPRLTEIRSVRVAAHAGHDFFGESVESLLFAAWISAQVGHHVDETGKVEGAGGAIEYRFERQKVGEPGGVTSVEIVFDDKSTAVIARDHPHGVVVAAVDGGTIVVPNSVTRTLDRSTDDLIVRQLKKTDGDPVLLKVLPVALRLAKRL